MLSHLTPTLLFQVNPFFNQSPGPNYTTPVDPPGFLLVDTRNYHLAAPTPATAQGLGGEVKTGPGGDATRAFRWLPYVSGRITHMPAMGNMILTGKMSGCWLALFRMNGVLHFGHIGTDSNSPTVNAEVKNAWKIAVGRGLIQPVGAFNPLKHVPDASVILGALGANNMFYALSFDEPTINKLKLKRGVVVQAVQQPQFL